MNGRTLPNQTAHDDLVRSLAKHYSSLGYKGIRADIPGSTETPSGIYWSSTPDQKYVPDIVCFKNDVGNTLIIAEVETCETLNTDHTKEQLRIFAAHAKGKAGEFHIMTPKECSGAAKSLAIELGITIHTYWTPGS